MVAAVIVDNFFDDYEFIRRYCDLIEYEDVVNPVDNVVYPGINRVVPPGVLGELLYKAGRHLPGKIASADAFFRLSLDGVSPPHQAHNDLAMGTHGIIVFLNRPDDVSGGTSFVSHVDEGMPYGPQSDHQQNVWARDTNIADKWVVDEMIEMRSNRAFIFDAARMHRPEPPLGFGSTNQDGRLVLVCFMTVAGNG
jgi:hypothetical protein